MNQFNTNIQDHKKFEKSLRHEKQSPKQKEKKQIN